MSSVAMLAAMHVLMWAASMNAHAAFAAAHQSRCTAFCSEYSMQKRIGSLSSRNGGRTGVLYASVAPKPPRRAIDGSTKDAIEDLHHKVHVQEGHNFISPNLSNAHHDPINGAHIEAESDSPRIAVQLSYNNDHVEQPTEQSSQAAQRHKDDATIAGITLFLSLAVAALMKYSPPGCWRYYLAGGICASTSHAITTPIDVVKTRQQVDPSLQEKSMWQATLAIVKTGGPFALLAGLGPTFIGYLIEGGVKFGIYEVSKPVTQRFLASFASFFSNPALNSRILSLILCGFISGTAASLMLSPMEALRIRMVSDEEFSDKNLIDAGATMMKQEGIQSLLKGLPAMFWKQVPYTITKNASFDLFTTWLYGAWISIGRTVTANMRIAIPLVSALAAAVLSCISSHPGDILLSLVNAHEGSKRTRDFAKDIMNGKDGIKGFFVGIKPRFVHVLMIVTVQLMIYDFVKRLVGIAATGMG